MSREQDEARARKIERVRKMLALANNSGATEHEAATALQMAQALMAEEDISDIEVLATEASEAFTDGGAKARVPAWEDALGRAIASIFACDAIHHHRGAWSFVGIDPLPEIATYAFDVLRRQCLQARKDYIAKQLKRVTVKANKTRRADLFCQGWVDTAKSKARRLPRATEHDQAVMAFKEVRYGTLATLKAVDRNKDRSLRDYEHRDRDRGRLAGHDAQLRAGMSVHGGQKAMLTRGGRS
ncbi:MAG: DUF2786 domain-containing protein [Rhodospirillaceae bacterium]|nr:DUF2786 domain-containing protein [Rhodospirillales bacterium]